VPQPAVSSHPGRDGARLAYREIGAGRPLILLHGLLSDGRMWLLRGHAERFAAAGFRVIMPDFRAHGESDKPHDATAYPPDVLADDVLALLEHLDLADYDLAGYSLGARIAVRVLVRGATPGRAVIGGQGMRELLGAVGPAGAQLRRTLAGAGTFAPGSPDARAEERLRSRGADPVALLHVVNSLLATPPDAIGRIQVRTLVVVGVDDERAASTDQLVAALPHGTLVLIPGDHAAAMTSPELATAILDFLTQR
jgi:pimeloyl-ACP methyl ester carboxylesterase